MRMKMTPNPNTPPRLEHIIPKLPGRSVSMNRPRRLPVLASLLILVIAVAVSAAATASFPGAVSAQSTTDLVIGNVRANGTANQITITWFPPIVAKSNTVGSTTYPRATGVSYYVLRFEDNQPRNVTPSSQNADVSTIVTGLEPGKRYHFSIQTCFDGTGGYSGCYLPEAYRAAYTAPKAPLHISANNVRGNEVSLSWEGGNTLDRTPLDFYDRFECAYQEFVRGVNTVANDCSATLSERAKFVTVTGIEPEKAYKFLVRHKERTYRTRITDNSINYDVAGSYAASPWREITVGARPPAPRNVRVTKISSTSARVEWGEIFEIEDRVFVGPVSYQVAYYVPAGCSSGGCQDYAKPRWGPSTTGISATVYNLDRNRDYEFSVLSRTEHRIGRSSGWVGVTSDDLNTAQSNRQTVAQRYDANDNGIVDQAELVTAINDFYDYYDRITYDELQELLDIYNSQQSE